MKIQNWMDCSKRDLALSFKLQVYTGNHGDTKLDGGSERDLAINVGRANNK